MSASTHEILTALARPFPADAVSWRVGQTIKGAGDAAPTHGRALAYIDARDCEDRLDEVAGTNWQSRHEIYILTEGGKDQILCVCHISLFLQIGTEGSGTTGAWVSRSNGSGQTDFEGRKGAMSKAFVRAASAWGVGRFLYAIGSPKVKIQSFGKTSVIDRSEEPRLRAIVEKAVREFETNPRMRPLMHEEPEAASPRMVASSSPWGQAQGPVSERLQTQQSAPEKPTAPPLLRAIHDSVTEQEALVALTGARQDRTIDPVAAEETFARWLCMKAAAARTEETLTRIEGSIGRASLGAKLARETRETISVARKMLAQRAVA
jgi:hypothetical protein